MEAPGPRSPARGLSPALTALAVLCLCFALNMAGRGIGDSFIVFLVPLSTDFGWSRAAATSIFSIYVLVTGLAAPFAGALFDRWGPRLVYPLGLACLGAACALAPALTRLWEFQLVIGALCGIGVSALGMVSASTLMSRWFRANLGTAIAVVYAALGIGALVVLPLAQYLIDTHGWRHAYGALGAGVLVLLPFVALLPWRALSAGRPEYRRPRASTMAAVPALRGAVRTPAYWLLVQVFFFTSLGMYTIIVQAVALLVDVGFAPLEAAAAYGIGGSLSVVGMTAAGWFSDRVGYRPTATATFAGTILGVLVLLALSYGAPRAILPGFVVFFGVFQGARGPIVASLCARLFPGGGFATIYGTIFAIASVGAALGSWIAGALHDATGGYRASLAFSIACLLLALVPFWVSRALAGVQSRTTSGLSE